MPATIRQLAAFGICGFFVLFFFADGVNYTTRDHADVPSTDLSKSKVEFPDFGRYRARRTLEYKEFPIDSKGRTIIVGDIHGMDKSLEKLLKAIAFNTETDVLIHVGDILAKGPHQGSMNVLEYMTTHNVTGVRGNHDEKVLEWRTWLEWIHALPGGSTWLVDTQTKWDHASSTGTELEMWLSREAKRTQEENKKWWKRVPHNWVLFGEHYMIAKAMTPAQAMYMYDLPLVLHVPHAHAFIAHAGILSSDPRKKADDASQPLSHTPVMSKENGAKGNNIDALRGLQELAILDEIPFNQNPWVTLNIRGVKKTEPVRDKDGTPWADLFNDDMERCGGFDVSLSKHKKSPLPCLPSTVVFGHAASRGLDVRRWTLGLDSGCVYERRLTALVLGSSPHRLQVQVEDEDEDEGDRLESRKKKNNRDVKFGDSAQGRIFSVRCKH